MPLPPSFLLQLLLSSPLISIKTAVRPVAINGLSTRLPLPSPLPGLYKPRPSPPHPFPLFPHLACPAPLSSPWRSATADRSPPPGHYRPPGGPHRPSPTEPSPGASPPAGATGPQSSPSLPPRRCSSRCSLTSR
jgi:hypothetical protein